MSAYYLTQDIRNYSTDDGEEYWMMGVASLIEALATERDRAPVVRFVDYGTGAIFRGSLIDLLGHVSMALRRGDTVTLEPVEAS